MEVFELSGEKTVVELLGSTRVARVELVMNERIGDLKPPYESRTLAFHSKVSTKTT